MAHFRKILTKNAHNKIQGRIEFSDVLFAQALDAIEEGKTKLGIRVKRIESERDHYVIIMDKCDDSDVFACIQSAAVRMGWE
jgi:hypothetical protein